MSIQLGLQVKDIVDGFIGIAISKVEYLNGCIQYGVQPPIGEDKKVGTIEWIDEQQLEVIGEGVTKLYNKGHQEFVDLPGGGFREHPGS